MGKFMGKAWRDDNGKEFAFCLAWGTVSRDPKTTCYSKPKVEFGLKWQRGQFLNVEAWGDSPSFQVCSSIEKGEMVVVMGIFKRFSYTTKDGEQKEGSAVTCDICVPMSLLTYILSLYSSSSLRMLIDSDQKADPMESAGDGYEEEYDDYEPTI